MPFKIQRVPRGLNDLLSVFGGQSPVELEDRIRGVLELTQLYGLTQRRLVSVQNAAAAEGSGVTISVGNNWCVLFDVAVIVQKTATMTALWAVSFIQYGGQVADEIALASDDMGPFGATETGFVTLAWTAPYPRLIPPNTNVGGRATIIGTDATANVIVSGNIGILG